VPGGELREEPAHEGANDSARGVAGQSAGTGVVHPWGAEEQAACQNGNARDGRRFPEECPERHACVVVNVNENVNVNGFFRGSWLRCSAASFTFTTTFTLTFTCQVDSSPRLIPRARIFL